ncbi:MAG: type II toxin-antitoxin system HicA family toxin [Planctomycetes bacterium]|nr:type II toxin-antitoxin system HicA family toxin [Planctomycetota bacterium]
MMARLPRVSGRQAVRAFEHAGFVVRRRRGSHVILVKSGSPVTLSVPDHREVATGTLRGLIRNAGMTVDEFRDLLA